MVCSSYFYHIWDLQCTHCYLDLSSVKSLANSLVSSLLDYCNSLLPGIAYTDLTKLRHVQNQLAHIIIKSPPFTYNIPLLRSLHWLPVKFRVERKICLLTYKTLLLKKPVYFHSMLVTSLPSRSLRSNKVITVVVPRVKTNTCTREFHS